MRLVNEMSTFRRLTMKRVVGIEFELSRNFLLCTVCAHFVLLLYVSVFLIISLKDSELVCF